MQGDVRPASAPSRGATVVSIVAAVATALVILGAVVALFFNPLWVGFEQGRTQVDAWTGWDAATIRAVTDSVVIEVFLGPGTFAQHAHGVPVFAADEAGHMADVRRVVLAFGAVVLLAAVALVVAWWSRPRREAFWRGVRAGSFGLAVFLLAAGVFAVFLFDTAFEVFHRVFFAAGTYSFDPATSRLVQLFPEAFWMETSIALGIVAIAASAVVALVAGRRRRAARAAAGPAT
jgi:integral membrane protein (TIGR01906 family)